jgi:hypothetical protein
MEKIMDNSDDDGFDAGASFDYGEPPEDDGASSMEFLQGIAGTQPKIAPHPEIPEDGEYHMVDFVTADKKRQGEPTNERYVEDLMLFQAQRDSYNLPSLEQVEAEMAEWDFSMPPPTCYDSSAWQGAYSRICSYRDRLGELNARAQGLHEMMKEGHKSFYAMAQGLSSGGNPAKAAYASQRTKPLERAVTHARMILALLNEKSETLTVMRFALGQAVKHMEALEGLNQTYREQGHSYNVRAAAAAENGWEGPSANGVSKGKPRAFVSMPRIATDD